MRKILFGFLAVTAGGCESGALDISTRSDAQTYKCRASFASEAAGVADVPCTFTAGPAGSVQFAIDDPQLAATWYVRPGAQPPPYLSFTTTIKTPTWSCDRLAPGSWATYASDNNGHGQLVSYVTCDDSDPDHFISAALIVSVP